MRLAEPDAAIEEERVEGHRVLGRGTGLGDAARRGVGELIRFADDKILECQTRIERSGKLAFVIEGVRSDLRGALGDGARRRSRLLAAMRRRFKPAVLCRDDKRNPPYRVVLGLP